MSSWSASCPPFAEATESDAELLRFVQQWDLWENESDPSQPHRETGFDKVPEEEREQLICMIAAKLTNESYERLYYRTPYGEVVHRLALALAAEYSPPPEGPQNGPR